MSEQITDSERWNYALKNPDQMVALFRLLMQGDKGNANDLTKLVDRVIAAEKRTET